MKLTIATKNITKYKSIKILISLISNKLDIETIQVSNNIPSPDENGLSASKNCLIKAKHYQKYINDPFIVIDDKIKFLGDRKVMEFGDKFHRLGGDTDLEPREIFTFIQNYLKNALPIIMVRTRYFGLVSDKNKQIFSSKFRATLHALSDVDFERISNGKINDNPLNYFSIPKGYNKQIWMYNTQKRVEIVYDKVTQDRVGTFLQNLKQDKN